jgi:hypothetical protein
MLEMSNRTVFPPVSKATHVSPLSVACFLSYCLAKSVEEITFFLSLSGETFWKYIHGSL